MAVLQAFRIYKGQFYTTSSKVESQRNHDSNEIGRTDANVKSPPSTFN